MVDGGLKRRSAAKYSSVSASTLESSEYDTLTGYRGKKYLGRSRQTERLDTATKVVLTLLVGALVVCLLAGYYCYYHFHWFHFHVARTYAHLGYPQAQHVLGERYLYGAGVEQDEEEAMRWFRLASAQDHGHASYNLAIGHLKGIRTDVRPGEVHTLVKHANDKGVVEAGDMLVRHDFYCICVKMTDVNTSLQHNVCANGHCD